MARARRQADQPSGLEGLEAERDGALMREASDKKMREGVSQEMREGVSHEDEGGGLEEPFERGAQLSRELPVNHPSVVRQRNLHHLPLPHP